MSDITEAVPQYLRVGDVAQMFNISSATVWRWVRAGKLPQPVKICGSTRWKLSAIQAACRALDEQAAA